MSGRALLIFVVSLGCCRFSSAEEQAERVELAIRQGMVPILSAIDRYPNHRKCFSCHHQTLPMLAIKTVREAGLDIDSGSQFQNSWKLTEKAFSNRLQKLRDGGRIGGDSATASHALWTVRISGQDSKELTEALLMYLVKRQHEKGYWKPQSNRPPLEGTNITTTVLTVSLFEHQTESRELTRALQKAESWLATAMPVDQQERAFLLWYLERRESQDETVGKRSLALLEQIRRRQQPDGGWKQLDRDEMESDAYATGQMLYFLLESGMDKTDPMISRAIEFLLNSQQDDGSWFVQTRSKPVQPWYDNGDPHDKSQFISTPASCWAIAALAKSMDRSHLQSD